MIDGPIQLSLYIGPGVPIPVSREILDALVKVEIREAAGPGVRSGFQMTFEISKDSILNTLLLTIGSVGPIVRCTFVLTISGTPFVAMDGVITEHQVTPVSDTGLASLTVTGEDLTAVMNQIDFTGIPYPAMPREARVALIVAKYALFGMIPLVIPSVFFEVPLPTETIPTHQGTDLTYIEAMANEVGYVFYIDSGPALGLNTAYWGPEIKVGAPQPALNVNMDAHTNVETISFKYDAQKAELPIIFIQNQATKVPIPIPIPPVNPLAPPLGLVPPIPTKIKMMKNTAQMTPIQALALGLAEAAHSFDVVSADGTLDVLRYGRLLRARQLVGLRGVGSTFNGLYFVQKVTSRFRRGEFKQDFTLTRNGLESTVSSVPN